jgi:beta-galactosidase
MVGIAKLNLFQNIMNTSAMIFIRCSFVPVFLLSLCLFYVPSCFAQRLTISLNGTWQIEDSIEAEAMPQSFRHRVQVPGLAKLAIPTFEDVDKFESREYIGTAVNKGLKPKSELTQLVGVSKQKRNYFWYQTSFEAPAKRELAILKINKAQFGTVVWVNGKKIGEHLGCFTAGYFNLSDTINWQGRNTLIVRVGAHPGVLPVSIPAGTDAEKIKWTPGIYDNVSLLLCNNPVIESVQIAPQIRSSEVLIQTRIKNYSRNKKDFDLINQVRSWKDNELVSSPVKETVSLGAHEEKTILQRLPIRNPILWSPETPFLYVVDTSTGSDNSSNRFGMREFRFDTATKKAYLNNKIFYLRGSNITLHRFFEDDKSGSLPWDEQWVRKLLADIPKKLHWNSFRFCIGPVPDKWLDIADEAGLLIQNEFFVWGYHKEWDTNEMIRQYSEWMRDNWNHPSVVIWDACNETVADIYAEKIIPSVRSLDLSDRPWDNGYNFPVGANDPVEDHPYIIGYEGIKTKNYTMFENLTGAMSVNSPHPTAHAVIANEYGWLWVNRDGTPTELTHHVFEKLAPNATPNELIALNSYMLAALTEHFRAFRNYAGILHFVYLTGSFPQAFTSDNFKNVEKLELHPEFIDYMGEAFKPLGVYIHLWYPTLQAGTHKNFGIMMVNDEYQPKKGRLVISLESASGTTVVSTERPFELEPLGQQSYKLGLALPSIKGDYMLKAKAYVEGDKHVLPTLSRRKISLVEKIENQRQSKALDGTGK